MAELKPSAIVLPIVSVNIAEQRTSGIFGSAWLARSNLVVTCGHCLPRIVPAGHALAVTRKNAADRFEPHFLSQVEYDVRGYDLATASVELSCAFPLRLYPGLGQIGMGVWAFGYPMPSVRPEPEGGSGFAIYPRYLRGYVTRRFLGDPPSYPKVELDMPCPPGLSGAPLVLEAANEVVGMIYGRHTIKVPDEDPAPLYHFGLALDREVLDGLRGRALGERTLKEVLEAQP